MEEGNRFVSGVDVSAQSVVSVQMGAVAVLLPRAQTAHATPKTKALRRDALVFNSERGITDMLYGQRALGVAFFKVVARAVGAVSPDASYDAGD